jgi:mRNA interferase RelE/StbE
LDYAVFLEQKVTKQLARLDSGTRSRILDALKELEEGFSARLDIKKLKGTKYHYRIRVGDYRILFMLQSTNAFVYDVAHRQSIYE